MSVGAAGGPVTTRGRRRPPRAATRAEFSDPGLAGGGRRGQEVRPGILHPDPQPRERDQSPSSPGAGGPSVGSSLGTVPAPSPPLGRPHRRLPLAPVFAASCPQKSLAVYLALDGRNQGASGTHLRFASAAPPPPAQHLASTCIAVPVGGMNLDPMLPSRSFPIRPSRFRPVWRDSLLSPKPWP